VRCCILVAIFVALTQHPVNAQWEPDRRLTFAPHMSQASLNSQRSVATGPGPTVHVVWNDQRDTAWEIYYKRSTDFGITWDSTDVRITKDSNASEWPSVAVSESTVHLVWMDDRDMPGQHEIYYARSLSAGAAWERAVRLTSAAGLSWYPSAAVQGPVVHVVWCDTRDGDWEVYYKRSTNSGATWEPDVRLTDMEGRSYMPSIALVDSLVHVVWFDELNIIYPEIMYRRSADAGVTWQPAARLTNDQVSSVNECVAASDRYVHVVWENVPRTLESDVYYRRSTDAGLTWEPERRLTNAPYPSIYPSVWAAGEHVHLAWPDARNTTLNYEIYYKSSFDAGTTWSQDMRLTDFPATSGGAHVCVADAVVHVVWYDYRDGNPEMYYKRNPTGNVGSEEPPTARARTPNVGPTIVRGVLSLEVGSRQHTAYRAELLDIAGRKVLDLRPGPNDVSSLAPGVYFARQTHGVRRQASSVTKVVLSR